MGGVEFRAWHRRRRAAALAGALLVAASSTACGSSLEPIETLQIGVIGFYFEDAPRIAVPDTVTGGEPFTVSVESYGNACFRIGPTEVDLVPGGAAVTPLDFVTTGVPCEDILQTFEHEASLSFGDAGLSRVVVRGRALPGGPVESFVYEVWVR